MVETENGSTLHSRDDFFNLIRLKAPGLYTESNKVTGTSKVHHEIDVQQNFMSQSIRLNLAAVD
jgi:hypothetical protein